MEHQVSDHRRLIERAERDEAFRSLLLSNPRQAVADELGVKVPDDVGLFIHEDTPNAYHLVLPAREGLLSEPQLEAVSGGNSYSTSCTCSMCTPM